MFITTRCKCGKYNSNDGLFIKFCYLKAFMFVIVFLATIYLNIYFVLAIFKYSAGEKWIHYVTCFFIASVEFSVLLIALSILKRNFIFLIKFYKLFETYYLEEDVSYLHKVFLSFSSYVMFYLCGMIIIFIVFNEEYTDTNILPYLVYLIGNQLMPSCIFYFNSIMISAMQIDKSMFQSMLKIMDERLHAEPTVVNTISSRDRSKYISKYVCRHILYCNYKYYVERKFIRIASPFVIVSIPILLAASIFNIVGSITFVFKENTIGNGFKTNTFTRVYSIFSLTNVFGSLYSLFTVITLYRKSVSKKIIANIMNQVKSGVV